MIGRKENGKIFFPNLENSKKTQNLEEKSHFWIEFKLKIALELAGNFQTQFQEKLKKHFLMWELWKIGIVKTLNPKKVQAKKSFCGLKEERRKSQELENILE